MKNFKKIIAILLILVMCFTDVALATKHNDEDDLAFPNYIKVGLYYSSSAPKSLSLYSEDGFNVYSVYTDEDGNDLIEFEDYIKDTLLDISTDSKYISEGEQKIYLSANEDIDERIVDVTVGNTTKQYRDGYLLYQHGGAIRIVNYVTLEHYAWGSLNCEMSYGRPMAALEAQAVAIRTYAMHEHHNGFNVCTSTDCLSYRGYSSENEKTNEACQNTEGLILTYDDEPILAYFSGASGGGYTSSLYDAWGQDDVPYLQTAEDIYTPIYTWHTTYTFPEIRQRIKNYYNEDLGEITYFEISKTTSTGAASQIFIKGTKGIKVIPRSQIMVVFNLHSNFFSIGSDEYHELVNSNSANEGSITNTSLGSKVYIMSANGKTEVSSEDIYVYNGKTTMKYQSSLNTKYEIKNDICTDGYVYMNGLGTGHGIGMSQTGAYAMGEQGFSYDEILNYYYKGVDIVEAKDVF